MKSKDFVGLMNLLYKKHFKVVSYDVKVSKGSILSTVSLRKGSRKIRLTSEEADFGMYVLSFKTTANADGNYTLKHIRNIQAYYDDIGFLVDKDESKLRDGIQKVREGKFTPDFNFEKEFNKLLSEKYARNDKKILKLKSNYYEIFAYTLFISKSYLDLRKKSTEKNPLFATYTNMLDSLLGKAFQRGKNMVKRYKSFKDVAKINIERIATQTLKQNSLFKDQLDMLAKRGKVRGDLGMQYVLDWYRRWCELSRDFINLTRYAYDQTQGRSTANEVLPFTQNVEILRNSPYSKLVESLDPNIRHTESHISTEIEYEEGKKGNVVLVDTRKGRRKILKRYAFKEVEKMTKTLQTSLYPALIVSFTLLEMALKLLVLRSPEYRFMLLRLGQ